MKESKNVQKFKNKRNQRASRKVRVTWFKNEKLLKKKTSQKCIIKYVENDFFL